MFLVVERPDMYKNNWIINQFCFQNPLLLLLLLLLFLLLFLLLLLILLLLLLLGDSKVPVKDHSSSKRKSTSHIHI